MGLLDRFKKAFETPVVYPSDEFGSSVEAIESFITRLATERGGDGWVDLKAADDARTCELQLTQDLLNLQLEVVDVPTLLREAGLEAAAGSLKDAGDCMWELPGATAAELATIVDLVIRRHFGLDPAYTLRAALDG